MALSISPPNDPGGGGEPVVLVIDDDIAIRETLTSLFRSVGLRVRAFGSAPELLQSQLPDAPSCAMSVQAMKAGAVDFLTKPVRPQEMIDAVTRALAADRKRRTEDKRVSDLRLLYESLTPREREVLAFAAAGAMNKLIAEELGIRDVTVKVHRSNVMRKMRTRSLADLARVADILGIRPTEEKRI
jgi:FixJ family two-component response regulator